MYCTFASARCAVEERTDYIVILALEAREAFRLPGTSTRVSATGDTSRECSRNPSVAPSQDSRGRSLASRAGSSISSPAQSRAQSHAPCTSTSVRKTFSRDSQCTSKDLQAATAVSNLDTPSPELDTSDDDSDHPWNGDDELTREDLASIRAEKSHYEKVRRHNIICNKRVLNSMWAPQQNGNGSKEDSR